MSMLYFKIRVGSNSFDNEYNSRVQQFNFYNHLNIYVLKRVYLYFSITDQFYIFYFMSLKNFDILCELGVGSFASVYKVRRHQDNQIYALKKVKLLALSQKQKDNALNQIRILASIKNPNIITYKESFLDRDTATLCLITEFADDGDLQRKISNAKSNNSPIDEKQIWSAFIQMAKALKSLHSMNIAHRDLKSANVFLFKNGKVKIGDMNVSKVIKNNLCITQTGTPYYASPQVWKDIPYNTKSDIWSLGCLIYEMAALHPPFMADNMEGLYKKVLKGIYSKISHKYSKSLRNLIRMMLQVDPESRPCINTLLAYTESVGKTALKKEEEIEYSDRGIQSAKNIRSGKQIKEFIKKLQKQNQQDDCISLLGTIKVPRKINNLIQKLPKPNYEENTVLLTDLKQKTTVNMLPSITRSKNQSYSIQKQKLQKVLSEKLLPLPSICNRNMLL